MSKLKKFKIEIEVEKLDKGAMFMHTQVASGKITGIDFTVDLTIPGSSIMLGVGKFEEGHRYIVNLQSIISPLLDFHFGKGKEIKVAEMPIISKKESKSSQKK